MLSLFLFVQRRPNGQQRSPRAQQATKMATDVSNGGASAKAKKTRSDADIKAMSSKQYMDELVVPTLLKALYAVSQKKPEDPLMFLSKYLAESAVEAKVAPPPPPNENAGCVEAELQGPSPDSEERDNTKAA